MKEPKPLRELKKLKDGSYELTLNMHRGQISALQSQARFILMVAGSQGGKTVTGAHWLKDEIDARGDGDYLAVTASFPLLEKAMIKEFKEVFENIFHLGKYKDSEKIFESHAKDQHGSPLFRVIFATATNPESIESATAKGAWLDEAGQVQFRRESWEAINRRLARYQGRILITTTPYTVRGWLKTEVYDRWADGDKDYDVIQFASNVNPAFPQEEFERLRRTLPEWKFNMMHRGLFDRPVGLVYDSFDQESVVIRRMWNKPPHDWPCYTGHDFGGANMACLWFAQDPATGYFYAYREYLESGSNVGGHVQKFKSLSEGENIVKSVGGSQTEDGWRDAFRMAGWPIQKPKVSVKRVADQIARVYQMHALNKILVFNDLDRYINEKLDFSYDMEDDGETLDTYRNESRYHMMASERYIASDFTPELVISQRAKAWPRYQTRRENSSWFGEIPVRVH
tara:strand:+ start:821 stop:2185 length:1365 start_codon:yes stop_codon:yes gene_type:complete